MSSRSFRVGRSVTGLGLFVTKPIKRGVYIAAYRGRRLTTEEADRREAGGAKYQFELNKRWTSSVLQKESSSSPESAPRPQTVS
jgi:selenophosphate synthase